MGSVSPNPMVGCVIVCDDKIIGEGFHRKYGGPHAEVYAVESVKEKQLLSRSTVYVNLEPCAHFGKTPPCADLLVANHVKKVVIANIDPNPLVAGKGVSILQNAGITVETGVMEGEGRDLNRRFFKSIAHKKPFVILKWAQTADGFIARPDFSSKWISNELSRKLVHKWRTEESAVLVGTNTALYDNPMLTSRDWSGKNPFRIVLDQQLRLPLHLHLLDKKVPTICFNALKNHSETNLEYVQVPSSNFLDHVLRVLSHRNIQSVMVEGGATTLQSFIDEGLWDEARVFEAPVSFGEGIRAPQLRNAQFEVREYINGDSLTWFKKK
jgi:diaminohydroxyphosphoribosylaminopyrimidine deaminase/5-amino-6-(5-phosphoribosylamino)uracil reductase